MDNFHIDSITNYLRQKVIKAKKRNIYLLEYKEISNQEEIRFTSTEGNYRTYIEQKFAGIKTVLRSQCRIYVYDGNKKHFHWMDAVLLQIPGKKQYTFSNHGAYAFFAGTLSFYSGNSSRSYLAFMTEVQTHDKSRPEYQLIDFQKGQGIVYNTVSKTYYRMPQQGIKKFLVPPEYRYLDPFSYCIDKPIREGCKKFDKGYAWKKIFLDDYPRDVSILSDNPENTFVSCNVMLLSHFSISDNELRKILSTYKKEMGEYILQLVSEELKQNGINPQDLKLKNLVLSPGRILMFRYG